MDPRRWIAIAAVGFATVTTSAYATTTIGNRTCGQWSARKQNTYITFAIEAWLMGYMTGLAVASGDDVLAGTDADSIYLWMDNYCQSHPLDRVGTGATDLFFELKARQRK
ncbi:hypothetical protein PTKU15_10800 [Paraburkholderia terrae]|nr:hypothetical protein PTKU15_10800 [Paraburkholderia terrae]